MSIDLTRREFRRVFRRVNGDEPLTFDRMLALIACAGKAISIRHLEQMWPRRKEDGKYMETISFDQAYSIYVRYDAPLLKFELKEEERSYFEGVRSQDLIDCIASMYPELGELALEEVRKYTNRNGDVDVVRLLQDIETVRKETLIVLTAPSVSNSSSPHKHQEYEPVEKTTGIRGVLIIAPPLITTTYMIKVPEDCKCTIELKLSLNSNTLLRHGEHLFQNDLFLLIMNKNGEYVGVTNHLTDKGVATDEITLENDLNMVVMSLGTTKPREAGEFERDIIVMNGKASKFYKVTLMNMFDMFDLDADNHHTFNEYNWYAAASGDTQVTREEWEKMKTMVQFRDDRMSLKGFVNFHELEIAGANQRDSSILQDCVNSLAQLGFDHKMRHVNATAFTLDLKCDTAPLIIPNVVRVNKEMRDNMIAIFYRMGTVDEDCELEPRTFRTDYFGLTIVDRIRALDAAGYRVVVEESDNVKWHFISGQTNIRPFTFESELVLICTWVATKKDYKVKYRLVREDEK